MKILWCISTLVLLLYISSSLGEIDSDTAEKIKNGVELVVTATEKIQETSEKLAEAGKAVGPLLGSIGKMAPFLGVAGAFLSVALAFSPQADSAELAFMKEKFAEVNRKLDKISSQLSDIETLITFETQRSNYITMEHNVNFGYKKLNQFYDELQKTSCSNKEECLQKRTKVASRYLADFRKVESALHQILKGSFEKSVFKESLLLLVQKKFKCNVAKLTEFTEGVFRLAEKGQQVVITYEKLTGSKTSVSTSLKTWLKLVYDLRNYYYNIKNHCYKETKTYFKADIIDMKYQSNYGNDKSAGDALGNFLETKYDWLKWNVLTYNAAGWENHAFVVMDGWYNMPTSMQDRKRVILANPVDPKGTYTVKRRADIVNAIKSRKTSGTANGCANDKRKCLNEIKEGIKAKGLWNYVQSITVLKKTITPTIRERRDDSIIDDLFTFTATTYNGRNRQKTVTEIDVRVVIMLRSVESSTTSCTTMCHTKGGKCVRLPYSKLSECQCKSNFDGDACKEHSKNGLASTLDLLVTSTLKVPTLVDIYFDVAQLKKDINLGFGKLDSAIANLASNLKTSYNNLAKALGQHFQWTNLKVNYVETIGDIIHFFDEFKTRSRKNHDERGKILAAHILKPGNIKQWVRDLNTLFMGSKHIVQDHQPLLIIYMNKYNQDACSDAYKNRIDNAYRQFAVLQQQAYLLWAQAVARIMSEEEDLEEVYTEYAKVVKEQDAKLSQMTCQYVIKNSVNINCNGRHIHPLTVVTNQCKANYYLKGALQSKCTTTPKSACQSCVCNKSGSVGSECTDQTGRCVCKVKTYQRTKQASYYGDKCDKRDCQWSYWGSYSGCSKSCGYGGSQTKTRHQEVTKYGYGKSCSGSSKNSRTCFNRCCGSDFNCSNKKKCIRSSWKCDYDNDCGDGQDEKDNLCREKCIDKSSVKQQDGGGKIWYMDRQYVSCGNSDWVMQKLHLQRSGSNIYYKYRCCQLNKNVAVRENKATGWSIAKSLIYLDRQNVECGSGAFMNTFDIKGKWVDQGIWKKDVYQLHYSYQCSKLNTVARRNKVVCHTSYTPYNSWGSGQNFYLDRHSIDCAARFGSRYFLRQFRLESKHGTKQVRYRFVCCRIAA